MDYDQGFCVFCYKRFTNNSDCYYLLKSNAISCLHKGHMQCIDTYINEFHSSDEFIEQSRCSCPICCSIFDGFVCVSGGTVREIHIDYEREFIEIVDTGTPMRWCQTRQPGNVEAGQNRSMEGTDTASLAQDTSAESSERETFLQTTVAMDDSILPGSSRRDGLPSTGVRPRVADLFTQPGGATAGGFSFGERFNQPGGATAGGFSFGERFNQPGGATAGGFGFGEHFNQPGGATGGLLSFGEPSSQPGRATGGEFSFGEPSPQPGSATGGGLSFGVPSSQPGGATGEGLSFGEPSSQPASATGRVFSFGERFNQPGGASEESVAPGTSRQGDAQQHPPRPRRVVPISVSEFDEEPIAELLEDLMALPIPHIQLLESMFTMSFDRIMRILEVMEPAPVADVQAANQDGDDGETASGTEADGQASNQAEDDGETASGTEADAQASNQDGDDGETASGTEADGQASNQDVDDGETASGTEADGQAGNQAEDDGETASEAVVV